jgi:tetratricopeptide (TPR) repeat protein
MWATSNRQLLFCFWTAATIACAAPSDTAASHRELGRNYLASHMPDRALAEFRQSLTSDPTDAESMDAIGSILGDSGNMSEAVPYFIAAIHSRPDMFLAHFHLALAYARIGQTSDAVSEYENCLWLNSNFTPAHYALSALCLEIGDIDGAIRQLQLVVQSIPNASEPHYNLGVAFRRQGLHDDEAVVEFRRAVQIDAANVRAQIALAELISERHEYKSAEETLRAALVQRPDSAEVHYTFGLILRSADRLEEAEREFRRTLEINPRYSVSRRALALLLRQNGKPDAARTELEMVIAELPEDAGSHYNLGSILMQQGNVAQAIPELRRAFEFDRLLTAAGFMLVQALSKSGRADEASIVRQEAESSDRRKKDAGRSIVSLQMAAQDSARGDSAAAVQVLTEAAAITPDFPDVHYQLALALCRTGERELCERELRTVLEIKPGYANARFELGKILEQRGQPEDAIKEFERTLSNRPSLTAALERLGTACIQTRQFDEAVSAYKGMLAWNAADIAAHLGLARAFRNLDQRQLAIAELEKITPPNQASDSNPELIAAARAELADLVTSPTKTKN